MISREEFNKLPLDKFGRAVKDGWLVCPDCLHGYSIYLIKKSKKAIEDLKKQGKDSRYFFHCKKCKALASKNIIDDILVIVGESLKKRVNQVVVSQKKLLFEVIAKKLYEVTQFYENWLHFLAVQNIEKSNLDDKVKEALKDFVGVIFDNIEEAREKVVKDAIERLKKEIDRIAV